MDFDMLQMTNSGWEIIGHMTIKELEKIAYDIEIEFELLNNVQINFDENKEDKKSFLHVLVHAKLNCKYDCIAHLLSFQDHYSLLYQF